MNDLLTIVFVNFYSEKKIIDYLKYFNNNFKIIIIDNANDLNLILDYISKPEKGTRYFNPIKDLT